MKIVRIKDLDPELIKGVTYSKGDAISTRAHGYIPLLRANNISDMRVNFDELIYVKSSLVKPGQYLQNGDIIFVTSSGSKNLVGKSALIDNANEQLTIGAFNGLLRFSKNINPRYVFFVLNGPSFKRHIMQRLAGANINNIKKDDILDFELPVPFLDGKPDLTEQKRITNKLDQLFTLKGGAANDTTKATSLITSVSSEWFALSPESGRMVTLKEICNITKGKSPTLKTKPGMYPFVVTAADKRTADVYQFDDEAVCIPLVSSTGHGNASLHRLHYQDGKFALANIMVALTAQNKGDVSMKYLYYYLLHYRNELFVPLMRGVANVTIPLGSIGDVPVNLPDIQEQKRVVEIFDEVEKLKLALSRRDLLINQLVRSVMQEAFTIPA
jgi:type I restriction enzyme S subunit